MLFCLRVDLTKSMNIQIDFSVTSAAADELGKALPDSDSMVRVSVVSSGCSGSSYGLGICGSDGVDTTDIVEEISGIRFVADRASAINLDGVVLDWYSGDAGEGFKFSNSKPKSCCRSGGCSR